MVRVRRKESIFVRKTLRVRLRDQQCVSIAKLGGKDLRFSMKMVLSAGFQNNIQPVRTITTQKEARLSACPSGNYIRNY